MKEIVIKIGDEIYESLTSPSVPIDVVTLRNLVCAIIDGKVLPKGHGELKDVTELQKTFNNLIFRLIIFIITNTIYF